MSITLTDEVPTFWSITEDRLVLPALLLERKLYQSVNKVIQAAGGHWDRRAKAHLFRDDPRKSLGLAHGSGCESRDRNDPASP